MNNQKKAALLLTPLLLATAPITTVSAENITATYSHASQTTTVVGQHGVTDQIRTQTYGGTQTFDVQGNPWDNDNDTD